MILNEISSHILINKRNTIFLNELFCYLRILLTIVKEMCDINLRDV